MKPLLSLALFVFSAVAACQQLPSLDVLLDRLDAYAEQYQATLPSLSCDEQITSQALNKKGKVTWEVKVQSTLREIRTDDPYAPFIEKREFKTIDGRRAKATFRMSELPYFAEGAFAGLVGFKRWEQRECFDYQLSPGAGDDTLRLEMTLKSPPPNRACAKLPDGFHRIVIADPATGRILHTERTIGAGEAELNEEVYFGGIDYAPHQLGSRTFWLPSRFVAHDADNTGRMTAIYTNCHRYTGELRIVP